MYKPPKRKKIKGEWWTTKWKWNLLTDSGEPCWGLCDPIDRTIWLDRLCPKDMIELVYVHEEGHALLYELCIMLPEDIEEAVVEGYARHLVSTYKMRPTK